MSKGPLTYVKNPRTLEEMKALCRRFLEIGGLIDSSDSIVVTLIGQKRGQPRKERSATAQKIEEHTKYGSELRREQQLVMRAFWNETICVTTIDERVTFLVVSTEEACGKLLALELTGRCELWQDDDTDGIDEGYYEQELKSLEDAIEIIETDYQESERRKRTKIEERRTGIAEVLRIDVDYE